MVTANISVLGLYVYDPTIFDGLAVPEGVNRETVVQNLLAELSGLEIIYPDAEFMRQFIPIWSAKELPVWQKLYNTTVLEYDPIMNYDRTEEWTENRSKTESFTGQTVGSNSANISDSATIEHNETGSTSYEGSGAGETLNKVAAYNSTNLENKDSSTNNESTSSTSENSSEFSNTRTSTIENSGSLSENSNSSAENSENVQVRRRAFGNMGVTTAQQMIEQERESALFNIYDVIIQSFKYRFCVLVY